MNIQINLTQEQERLLKARYKREGVDLDSDLTNWVLNQVAKEQRNMDMTGATLEQVEVVATRVNDDRVKAKQEAEQAKNKLEPKLDK